MKKILYFIKKETVLSIAVVLAVMSVFFVAPDREYISYIDFRTLAILFCLMSIVAGLRNIDVFDKLAERLLAKVHGIGGVTVILVCLCFFMSMFITNDVSLALEMRKYGIITSDVTLATGLPFTRYGAEKEEFIKYLGQNKHVEFKYEDTSYSININPHIYVFPQGYAAIVSKLPSIKGSCFLVDIGTGTTEILPISGEGRIDLKRAYTMQWGINNCFTMINETISQEYQTELSQDQIIDIMLDRESGISPKIKELVITQIKRWSEETFRQLHSRKVNYEFVPSFFMGGGAGLINRYSENQPEMITFIDDIRANAAGYELLANSVEKRGKK